jgi:uncharacterized protein (TIGR00251 family)
MTFIADHPEGILLSVYVQPRSSRNMTAGLHGNALKLKLTAPPVDGAANQMCLKFLAALLDLPVSALEIVRGRTSRSKQVLVRPKSVPADPDDLMELKSRAAALAG